MTRKHRIIISIVGIVLVTLILIGVTYGYFLTKIKGNNNTNSISVVTASLALKYDDGNGVVVSSGVIPGETLKTKTFTVENTGNGDVNNYSVGLVNIVNTFTRTDDIKFTIVCSSSVDNKKCNGVNETSFPDENSILLNNQIDVNEVQTYVLKVEYKNVNEDQSIDMGKEFSGKIDIFSINSLTIQGSITNSDEKDYVVINSREQISQIVNGNYKFVGIEPDDHTISVKNNSVDNIKKINLSVEKGTNAKISNNKIIYDDEKNVADIDIEISDTSLLLSIKNISEGKIFLKDKIIDNAKIGGEGRTMLSKNPLTVPAEVISGNNERTISLATDDYGDSYYFRGNVIDNYVDFADMCFRIVRIEGSGSIKLVLEDEDNNCKNSNGNWNISAFILDEKKNYGIFGLKYYTQNTLFDDNGLSNVGERWIMDYLNGYVTYALTASDAFKSFQKNNLSGYINKLESGNWCLADNAYANVNNNSQALNEDEKFSKKVNGVTFYYDANVRHFGKSKKEPTLKCNGTILNEFADKTNMYVGTLTADEVVYAGGKVYGINSNFYLINDYQKNNSLNYWTLTPIDFNGFGDAIFYVKADGTIDYYDVSGYSSFRPSIRLKSNVIFVSGDGTKDNAYVFE